MLPSIRSRHGNLSISLLLTLVLCVTASAQEDYPPGTFRLTPRIDLGLQSVPVHVPPQFAHVPQDLRLNLPPGFRASVYAAFESVRRPRFMAFSPDGVLHVANMDDDQIVALPDRDGDGVADEAVVVATNFERPHSLQFYDGDLYVGDRPRILRYRDGDGDGVFEEREVFVDNIPSSGSHSTRTLVINEAAGKMYLGVGWPCDLCRVDGAERGSILEFNLDGSGRRVYATGVRNVIGMDIHPVTGQLWGTNNGHDLEGIDAPPEWIDVIRDGGFYGIPLAYGYQVWADFTIPAYRDNILPITAADSARVATMQRPAALIPAHTAPMGIHFYDHEQFPARYRHAAFVALHAGHAKLAPIEGYSVVALFTEPDGSRPRLADFITGFQTGVEVEDVWGYPNGVISDEAGALYVSSDLGNRLILKIEHGPLVADWGRHNMPDTLVVGAPLAIDAMVLVERGVPGAAPPMVSADLSELGGPADVALQPAGDHFRLQFRMVAAPDLRPGLRQIRVHVRQADGTRRHEVRLNWPVAVLPALRQEDLVIFDEELAPGWTVVNKTWLENRAVDLQEDQYVLAGDVSASFRTSSSEWDWVLRFRPREPIDPTAFDRISFAFHPGVLDWRNGEDLNLYMCGHLIDLIDEGLVDPAVKDWQRVEIPLSRFGRAAPIAEVTIGGDFSARVYVDDLRLRGGSPRTAIREEQVTTPGTFALSQSYPNPFNSSTVIEYSVPTTERVRLRIYNLAGQVVAHLVDEPGIAGTYRAIWDARDETGQAVASGVYLYRLQAGDQVQSRKLILVR